MSRGFKSSKESEGHDMDNANRRRKACESDEKMEGFGTASYVAAFRARIRQKQTMTGKYTTIVKSEEGENQPCNEIRDAECEATESKPYGILTTSNETEFYNA